MTTQDRIQQCITDELEHGYTDVEHLEDELAELRASGDQRADTLEDIHDLVEYLYY